MTNKTEKEMAWIGFSPMREPLRRELFLELGQPSTCFNDAQEGISGLENKNFDILILDEEIAAGDLELPSGVSPGDYVSVGCHTIRNIRQISGYQNTPIIIPKIDVKPNFEKPYLEAGATACVDVWSGKHTEVTKRLLDEVRKYI